MNTQTPSELESGAPAGSVAEIAAFEGKSVRLRGWLYNKRSSGKLHFLEVRDGTGIVQCVVANAHDLRSEYVLRITGTVRERPEGTANPNIATGEVEVGDCDVEILNTAEPPPFPVSDRIDAGYRFIAWGDDMVFMAEKVRDEMAAARRLAGR